MRSRSGRATCSSAGWRVSSWRGSRSTASGSSTRRRSRSASVASATCGRDPTASSTSRSTTAATAARPFSASSLRGRTDMKFLCLIYEDQSTFDRQTPEEWRRLRTDVLEYVERLRADGRLLDAQPLQRADRTSVVRVRKGNVSVTDGPFIETKEQIGGFFIVDVADKEEAIRLAAEWPSAHLGTIEVRPLDEGLPTETRYV